MPTKLGKEAMLIIGLILSVVALVATVIVLGFITSPVTAPAKFALVFLVTVAIMFLVAGVAQQSHSIAPRKPFQHQTEDEQVGFPPSSVSL